MDIYRTVNYYGKLNIIVKDNREKMNDSVTTGDVLSLVQAIENDEMDSLKLLLSELAGKNISDILVKATLPKRWHHVVKTVKSTPLRTAITWRNTLALDAILQSECVITNVDISVGLQKILRHVEGDTEIYIIAQLVKNGAEVDNPAGLNLAFEKLILQGELDRCRQVVDVICQSKPTNALLGMLLLSVCRQSAKNQLQESQEVDCLPEKWREFSVYSMRKILEKSFSPKEFLSDTKMWLCLGNTSFHRLVFVLPLLIQTMTTCEIEALGWLLRYLGRSYGLMWAEGKTKLCELPQLILAAGIDFRRLMSVACLSPRFMHDTGFSEWLQQSHATSRLQDLCRTCVRHHLMTSNVYSAMNQIKCIPPSIRDFILLKEIQPLPWETKDDTV